MQKLQKTILFIPNHYTYFHEFLTIMKYFKDEDIAKPVVLIGNEVVKNFIPDLQAEEIKYMLCFSKM